MLTQSYNPDVLTCLANLSNDEVFTPPNIVNQMLDLLPPEIWQDKNATFLDPATKTGVFLREIAKRLMIGLEKEIPDQQKRINHIFTKQLYGIAITDITAILSRRSVYCSKKADGKYSVCEGFDTSEGNIIFKWMAHTWEGERCKYCGASENVKEYNRNDTMESHAYQFIHTDKPEEIFKMKFDVIIGNPPYQLSTGGSVESQAIPIYNKFIEQAKKLSPRYLSMITPSRWFTGGFGLDKFRDSMLNDNKLRVIHDYIDANDCFPGVQIKGGVSFFLWDRDNEGLCKVYTHKNQEISYSERPLLESGLSTFIRWNEAVSIIHKVKSKTEPIFSDIVSPRDPFGLNYFEGKREIMFKKFQKKPFKNGIEIYSQGWLKNGISYADKKYITTREELVGKWKVFISKAYGASENYPHQILNKPFIGKPQSCCNMTYLVIGGYDKKETANNVISYIQTRFFRFLVGLLKNTQNAYRQVYSFVPMQDFSESWTDEKLYKKYKLSKTEIEFIETMIRPMGESEDE
ncbi:MAG: restriction endonuclease [Anaerolineae bacterium UTCFX1]|jgi:site-specific DNA-methyltransferase (adenine-specific)|nr:MAG: restriction endonuclease [Anaerolineae bacterium UTCFX1]